MTNANDARRAHRILDDLFEGNMVLDEEREFLRNSLPELPKQMKLEEITDHVRDAWIGASGNEWAGNSYNREITLESWMGELYVQLKGFKDTPATVHSLPAGMHLADHENFGRVVTSPKPNRDGIYDLLVPKPKFETGADWEYAHECELTFIDYEPAKSAHPEFLDAEADYENAPNGTVVGVSDRVPWVKIENGDWICGYGTKSDLAMALDGRRQVLRWGWGE